MKKKRWIKLVSMLVVLVVLVAGYVALSLQPADEEESDSDESFTVTKVDKDTINKIVYTQGKKNEKIELDLKKKTWYSPTDKDCPVNEYTVSAMLSALSEIKSTRKIESKDIDRELFGLDNPSKVVTFTTEDGKETTYTLGVLNEAVNKYYFQVTGDENVYLVDSTMYNACDYDLLGLAKVEEYPSLGNQDIYEFILKKGNKTLYFEDKADAAHKKNETEIPDCEWLKGTSKTNGKAMNKDSASDLVQAVIGLTNTECVTYKKTAKDLKKYGFTNPTLTLTVNYTEQKTSDTDDDKKTTSEIKDCSFKVYFGNTDKDSGEYYVYMDGSDVIYTMNVSNVETLLKAFK